MWLCLSDAFFSIVHKDCARDELLVRARRQGDIQKVFGKHVPVTRATDADYLFRAVISRGQVEAAMLGELRRITYPNFKNSVHEDDLHDAYNRVWHAMASVQNPPPYSDRQPPMMTMYDGPEVRAAKQRQQDEFFKETNLTGDTFARSAARKSNRKRRAKRNTKGR